MINAIVCVGRNWEIGKKNDLLFHIKADMRFFRQQTDGHVVAMGWNTFKSLGSKPLKNRTNLVLAPEGCEAEGCVTLHSFEAMLNIIQKYSLQDEADVYVIGGGMFYKSMLPYYDRVFVTKVDAEDKEAEVFFPNLDDAGFRLNYSSPLFLDEESHKYFKFTEYLR